MSDSVIGIEDLLGRYREAGEVESSGAFTLDPKKALEKLAEFQLPSAYHWILKVIQSLHLSGATRIEIEAGIHHVRLAADAVPTGFANMEDLLGHLLADPAHCSPALRHLAAGLQGSLTVRPSEVTMKLFDRGVAQLYVLRQGGWRQGVVGSEPSGVTRFEFKLSRNVSERLGSSWFTLNTDIFDLFFRRPGSYNRESAVVYNSCPFSGCSVRLSGKLVSQRLFGHPRYPGYEISKDPNPGERTVPLLKTMMSNSDLVGNAADRRHHLIERVVPSTSGRGFFLPPESHATVSNRHLHCYAEHGLSRAYAIRMELSQLALLVFIEDGVIIDTKTLPMGCPGLVCLIDAAPLRKDLTTLAVVEDETLRALYEEVKIIWAELRHEALEQIHRMPGQSNLLGRL